MTNVNRHRFRSDETPKVPDGLSGILLDYLEDNAGRSLEIVRDEELAARVQIPRPRAEILERQPAKFTAIRPPSVPPRISISLTA